MSRLRSGSATDRGNVRPVNQDRVIVSDDLVAVADGMGGHVGGEVAARTAVETLLSSFSNERSSDGLVTAVQMANRTIWEESRTKLELRGMGTTLTAAALVDDEGAQHLTLVNVGDSRAYLFEGGELVQLTRDHSLVEEMVRNGELTADEAATHPHRHILTRALGIDKGVDIDAWQLEPPDGTRVLLCSDGLTNELSEEEIVSVLASVDDPAEAASELVEMAVEAGGNDNVSAVVVDVLDDSGAFPKAAGSVPVTPLPHQQTRSRPAGSTEGLTGAVPAVPLSIAASTPRQAPDGTVAVPVVSGDAGAAADHTTASPAVAAGEQAGGAGDKDHDRGTRTTVVPAVPAAAAAAATAGATAAVPVAGDAEDRPGGSRRSEMLINRALESGALGNGHAPEDVGRPVLLVAPKRERSRSRERLVTTRVVIFSLALVLILGGIAATVGWFAQSTYYVGLQGGHIVIFQGRPGGMLWFQPTVVERTPLTAAQIIPPERPALKRGVMESSLDDAKALVSTLANSRVLLPLYSSTTTIPQSTIPQAPIAGSSTTVPTTTLPPPTTTTTLPFVQTTVPPTTTTVPPTTTTVKPKSTTTTTVPPTTTTTPPKHGKGGGH